MARHLVTVFNYADQADYLAALARELPVDIHHVSFAVPWKEVADRRAGIIGGGRPVPADLRRLLANTNVILGFGLPLKVTEMATRLRWVETPAVGHDQLHGTGVLESGIPVTTVGAAFAGAVAEHAFALALSLTRRLGEFRAAQVRREWAPLTVGELQDATIAIVGLGNIGRAVAAAARAFGMRVVGTRRRTSDVPPGVDHVYRREELHRMLGEADVVVVSVAGTPETRHLIGAAEFAAMKPGAFFINIARGIVVDEAALAAALACGRLGGAGLDVFVEEPLSVASPLWEMPNVIATPHIAVNVPSKMRRAAAHFAHNLARFCRGEALLDLVAGDAGVS